MATAKAERTKQEKVVSSVSRVNYFQYQLLQAEDFQDEQNYHIAMRRQQLLELYTSHGVIAGLEVSKGNPDNAVQISPGIAIDQDGQILVVNEPLEVDNITLQEQGSVVIFHRCTPDKEDAEARPRIQEETVVAVIDPSSAGEPPKAIRLATLTASGNSIEVADARRMVHLKQEEWRMPKVLANGVEQVEDDHDSIGYFKDSMGIVHLRGKLNVTGKKENDTLFELESGYQPESEQVRIVGCSDKDRWASVTISPFGKGGKVKLKKPEDAEIYFDGITFRAKQ